MMSGDTQRSYSETNYSDPSSAIKANMNALKTNIKELTKQISEVVSQSVINFDVTNNKPLDSTYYSFTNNNIPTVTISGNLDVEIIKGLENSYEFKPYQSVFNKGIPELEVNENEDLAELSLKSGNGLRRTYGRTDAPGNRRTDADHEKSGRGRKIHPVHQPHDQCMISQVSSTWLLRDHCMITHVRRA